MESHFKGILKGLKETMLVRNKWQLNIFLFLEKSRLTTIALYPNRD